MWKVLHTLLPCVVTSLNRHTTDVLLTLIHLTFLQNVSPVLAVQPFLCSCIVLRTLSIMASVSAFFCGSICEDNVNFSSPPELQQQPLYQQQSWQRTNSNFLDNVHEVTSEVIHNFSFICTIVFLLPLPMSLWFHLSSLLIVPYVWVESMIAHGKFLSNYELTIVFSFSLTLFIANLFIGVCGCCFHSQFVSVLLFIFLLYHLSFVVGHWNKFASVIVEDVQMHNAPLTRRW